VAEALKAADFLRLWRNIKRSRITQWGNPASFVYSLIEAAQQVQ
jgi:hypothetical protein